MLSTAMVSTVHRSRFATLFALGLVGCTGSHQETLNPSSTSTSAETQEQDCVPREEWEPEDIGQTGEPCEDEDTGASDSAGGEGEGTGGETAESQPDLVVSALGMSSWADTPGSWTVVTLRIENQGATQSVNPQLRIFFSEDREWDSSDPSVYLDYLGEPLSAGEEVEREVEVEVPDELGTFHVGVRVDPIDRIEESDESNNERTTSGTFEVSAPDERDIKATHVSASPSSVTAGSDLDLEALAVNAGTTDITERYEVAFWLSASGDPDADGYLLCTESVDVHVVDEDAEVAARCATPSVTGSYYVVAVFDALDEIDESDESNNRSRSATSITLSAPTSINLEASSPPSWGTTTLGVDEPASASFTVSNTGTGASGSFYVEYYLSTNSTLGSSDNLIDRVSVSSISAGSSRSASWSGVPPEADADDYYIIAVIDADATVAETDETDNTSASTSTAQLLPDIEPLTVTVTDTRVERGDPLPLELDWQSSGGTLSRIELDVVFSTNTTISPSDTVLYSGYWSSISGGPHSTTFTSTSLSDTVSGGWYYIGVLLDPDHDIAEYDDGDNNLGSTTAIFYVNPGVEADPTSASSGDVLDEDGWGFTPGGTVDLYFKAPGGSYTWCCSYTADSDGEFSHTYTVTSGTAHGTWYYYAKDSSSGLSSDPVSFTIY